MKIIKSSAILLMAALFSVNLFAQKIKLEDGDLTVLKGETSINIVFKYDNMSVGKYDTEKEYLAAKTAEYNKKEAGRGDSWAKNWVNDRKSRFEPKFNDLFASGSDMQVSSTAKYTLIFHTTSTEPGYNIVISRKNAEVDANVSIVETANQGKVLATVSVKNALGRIYGGYDYDTGTRIAECYADAGKALGKFIKKKKD